MENKETGKERPGGGIVVGDGFGRTIGRKSSLDIDSSGRAQ